MLILAEISGVALDTINDYDRKLYPGKQRVFLRVYFTMETGCLKFFPIDFSSDLVNFENNNWLVIVQDKELRETQDPKDA